MYRLALILGASYRTEPVQPLLWVLKGLRQPQGKLEPVDSTATVLNNC